MESKYQEEEEEEEEEEEGERSDEVGVGRSYECVFCKRGFNTAQALGGHMNIHRKDRSRNNKPISPSTRLIRPPNYFHHDHQFPPSTSTTYVVGGNCDHQHQILSDDHHLQLQPPLVPEPWPSFMEGLNQNRILAPHQHMKEELDLELRLGYHS